MDYASRRPATRQSQKASERRASLSPLGVNNESLSSITESGSGAANGTASGAESGAESEVGDDNAEEDDDDEEEGEEEELDEDEAVVGEDLSDLLHYDRANRFVFSILAFR